MYDLCIVRVYRLSVVFAGTGAGVYLALKHRKTDEKIGLRKKGTGLKPIPKRNTEFFKL